MRMNSRGSVQERRNERLLSRVGAFGALAKGVWMATPRLVVSRVLFACAIIAIAGSSPKAALLFEDGAGLFVASFGIAMNAIAVSCLQKMQVEIHLGLPLASVIHGGSAPPGVDPAEALHWMRVFDAARVMGVCVLFLARAWPKGNLGEPALEHFSRAPIHVLIAEAKSAGAKLNDVALERIVAAEAGELWSMENSDALKKQRRSEGGLLFIMIVGAALASFAISAGALLAAKVEWRLLMATAVDVGKKAAGALGGSGTLIEKGLAAIVIVSERDEEALRTRAKMENEKTGARNGR